MHELLTPSIEVALLRHYHSKFLADRYINNLVAIFK